MKKKSLIKTNPYLKDPAKRHAMFVASATSSTAIEGVGPVATKAVKTTLKSGKSLVISAFVKSGKSRK